MTGRSQHHYGAVFNALNRWSEAQLWQRPRPSGLRDNVAIVAQWFDTG